MLVVIYAWKLQTALLVWDVICVDFVTAQYQWFRGVLHEKLIRAQLFSG
jgi:hypothetical protein